MRRSGHARLGAALALVLGLSAGAGAAGWKDLPDPHKDKEHSDGGKQRPLVIEAQGNRPFGGTTVGDPTEALLHCDHGYIDYKIPPHAREIPLLMVHASSKKTWETTFDGREGFKPIFVRRGFAVYQTDLPRTGQAGQGCAPTSYEPQPNRSQSSFNSWRLGPLAPRHAGARVLSGRAVPDRRCGRPGRVLPYPDA